MLECEVRFDYGEDTFQLEQIGPRNFHNAYDADENGAFFRADALFTHENKAPIEVPVFAAQMSDRGPWRWYVRFRPTETGRWILRIRVLSQSGGEPVRFGFDSNDYERNPDAQRRFVVYNSKKISGPLELPLQSNNPKLSDNPNYFYRWTIQDGKFKRSPFFLLGLARPWVSERRRTSDRWSIFSYLDRNTELFEPMQHLNDPRREGEGCNILLHWMAPWESNIVHQSPYEYWYSRNGVFRGTQSSLINEKSYLADAKLEGNDIELGYKRYDQGRSLHLDQILNLADEHNILIFLAVMPHPLLRDFGHNWGSYYFGKYDYGKYQSCKKSEITNVKKHPSQLNGFQLFKNDSGKTIDIEEFFSMVPPTNSAPEPPPPVGNRHLAKERLFKHYANFWRYLIGRWTSHPAFGGWILIDEMDGVGKCSDWWWKKHELTYAWHDTILKLLREHKELEKWEGNGIILPYTGDYMRHPITSSATDYQASDSNIRDKIFAKVRKKDSNITKRVAFRMLNEFKELTDHGTWRGGKDKPQGSYEKVDFVSHHAYQYVPTWGHWNGRYNREDKFTGWIKSNNIREEHGDYINTDRWLWDSLCMRLYNWSKENTKYKCPRLITEYGCIERDDPLDNYNKYGDRYPSYAHFANWASLVLGHAGVPFKWNNGKEFGEMAGRGRSPNPWDPGFGESRGDPNPWDPNLYPNNYEEIGNIINFLKNREAKIFVDLDQLRKASIDDTSDFKMYVLDENSNRIKVEDVDRFNVWGLANNKHTTLIAWVYDRTFSFSKEGQPIRLKVELTNANTDYRYHWFNTWTGQYIQGDQYQGIKTSDAWGNLSIPFPVPFPVGSRRGIAHGNDIAIYISTLQMSMSETSYYP